LGEGDGEKVSSNNTDAEYINPAPGALYRMLRKAHPLAIYYLGIKHA
jgi:hypothetical protein